MAVPIYADTAALSRLSRSLRAASKEAWKAYKVGAAAGAEIVLADAKKRASFPTKSGVPATFANSGVVKVTAGGNPKLVFPSPSAAPIENGGKGFVRHPTFGRRGKGDWTDKNSHPAFAAPALAAHEEQVVALVEKALVEAISRVL